MANGVVERLLSQGTENFTLKSRKRLEQIVLEVGIAYDRVWYFSVPRLLPVLRELAAAAPYSNIAVHRYPPRAVDLVGAALTN